MKKSRFDRAHHQSVAFPLLATHHISISTALITPPLIPVIPGNQNQHHYENESILIASAINLPCREKNQLAAA
jgi:hypothetical protein